MQLKPALLGNTPVFTDQVPVLRPFLPHRDELLPEIQDMLSSGKLTAGQHLKRFEAAVADHLGTRHALAVSSCTTGLMLTYRGRVQSRHSQNLDFSETSILQTSSMVYEVNTEIVLDWE